MLLYHYSTEKYPTLRTLGKQRTITQEERAKAEENYIKHRKLFGVSQPGYYFEHISFFFEPIPRNIYDYFPEDHQVWKHGNKLYEYTVELTDRDKFEYEIVEMPERMELYYNEKISDQEFFKRVGSMLKNGGYIGKGVHQLERTLHDKELLGKQEEFFKLLPSRPNYDKINHKYAATVPHVMLYPLTGVIAIKDVKLITLK